MRWKMYNNQTVRKKKIADEVLQEWASSTSSWEWITRAIRHEDVDHTWRMKMSSSVMHVESHKTSSRFTLSFSSLVSLKDRNGLLLFFSKSCIYMCVNKTNKEWLYKEITEFFFEREKISVTPKMAITLWSIKRK